MVAHFWIEHYGGMAWSAITVGAGILAVGVHVAWRLRHASLPRAVSAHIMLAFLNILGAATLGVLIGFDKVYHFLPGFVLANVFAHAHLAALGWATMMVVGVAYRLLPMILPAAMPSGRRLWVSAVLLQAGVSGLFVTLLLRSPLTWIFALTIVAAFAAFISQVVWMLRRPRPRPPGLRRPDPAVLHAGASFASLGIAVGAWGVAHSRASPRRPRCASRWRTASSASSDSWRRWSSAWKGDCCRSSRGIGRTPTPDIRVPCLRSTRCPGAHGQELVFMLWLFGVPVLAGGLAFDAIPFVTRRRMVSAGGDPYQCRYRRQNSALRLFDAIGAAMNIPPARSTPLSVGSCGGICCGIRALNEPRNDHVLNQGEHVRHVYFSALMFTALLTSVIQGANAEIRVLSPPLVEAALEELASAYTKETGTTVTLKSDVMGRIINTIQTDTPAADVILLPVNLMDSLEKDGGVKPGTRVALARVEIGLAVPRGCAPSRHLDGGKIARCAVGRQSRPAYSSWSSA